MLLEMSISGRGRQPPGLRPRGEEKARCEECAREQRERDETRREAPEWEW